MFSHAWRATSVLPPVTRKEIALAASPETAVSAIEWEAPLVLAAARLVTPQQSPGVRQQLTFLRAQLDAGAADVPDPAEATAADADPLVRSSAAPTPRRAIPSCHG